MPRKAKEPIELAGSTWISLVQAAYKENDVVCALVAAAAIENALISLLVELFSVEDNSSTLKRMIKSGALSDLSGCADLAYCLGRINKAV
jgi:hypothetical protein